MWCLEISDLKDACKERTRWDQEINPGAHQSREEPVTNHNSETSIQVGFKSIPDPVNLHDEADKGLMNIFNIGASGLYGDLDQIDFFSKMWSSLKGV